MKQRAAPSVSRNPKRTPSRGQQVVGADGSANAQWHPGAAGKRDRSQPPVAAGRRASEEGGPPAPSAAANMIRAQVHFGADAALEARFAAERDDDPELLDAIRRCRRAFLEAEIGIFARARANKGAADP